MATLTSNNQIDTVVFSLEWPINSLVHHNSPYCTANASMAIELVGLAVLSALLVFLRSMMVSYAWRLEVHTQY